MQSVSTAQWQLLIGVMDKKRAKVEHSPVVGYTNNPAIDVIMALNAFLSCHSLPERIRTLLRGRKEEIASSPSNTALLYGALTPLVNSSADQPSYFTPS
jgi:hypothetical protein